MGTSDGGKGQPPRKARDLESDFESTTKKPATGSNAVPTRPPEKAPAGAPRTSRPAAAVPRGSPSPSSDFAPAPERHPAPSTPAAQAAQVRAHYLTSGFEGTKSRAQEVLGAPSTVKPDSGELAAVGPGGDGKTPAASLMSRDVWRAINPHVQSRENSRSAEAYRAVVDQFAVGVNPRYEPDAPDKPRSHIFVWDVTRAMHAEVPHFVGARELTLGQTVDWIRHEGPMRGWVRADAAAALEAANKGYPTLALPKDIKVKLIAVVLPGEMGSDYKPKVSAAAKLCGSDLLASEALGAHAVDYFFHP